MSRSFLGFGQVPYIGQPFTNPIKLAGIAGLAIPLLFQWLSYGASTLTPSINVLVDCDTAVCKNFDQIRSIYIDNLGSPNPVYVYCPDTGYTVSAKANSEGWYPAYTNSKKVWVVGQGFLTGNIPQAFIILSNIALLPNVNTEIDQAVALWRASPVITRGTSIYNNTFGIPALGDQFFSSSPLNLSTGIPPVNMWNTPYSSGFLYITNLQVNMFGSIPPTGSLIGNLVIESTGVAGQLILLAYNSANSYGGFGNVYQSNPGVVNLLNMSGIQVKLDATQTWRMRLTLNIGSGFAQAISAFTQQPN